MLFHITQDITAQQAGRCTKAQKALLNSAGSCGEAFMIFHDAHFKLDDGIMSSDLEESLYVICQQSSCIAAVSEYLDACTDLGTVSV